MVPNATEPINDPLERSFLISGWLRCHRIGAHAGRHRASGCIDEGGVDRHVVLDLQVVDAGGAAIAEIGRWPARQARRSAGA